MADTEHRPRRFGPGSRTTLFVLCLTGVSPAFASPVAAQAAERDLRVETFASGLDTPWDMVWGPDGMMWVTERPGRVSRIDPTTGEVSLVGEVPNVFESGEAGLMGMTFHPDFDSEPYVYLVHSYQNGDGVGNRLVRLRYQGGRFGPPETLIDGILGRRNHDGSRLAVGPDGFLYMTMGDAGRQPLAQDLGSLNGKILRLTLEGGAAPGNPFGSRVYSYGHRNTQGLVFHPETGQLYVSEHGPRDNDEVHRIVMGGNHGWPAVHGRCDGDTDGEEAFCRENLVVESIAQWSPTVGIAGADFYMSDAIPGWRGSLLIGAMRGARLIRLALSEDGRSVVEEQVLYQGEYGRLRDVLVGPDGAVYLAVSNQDGRGDPHPQDDRILKVSYRRPVGRF